MLTATCYHEAGHAVVAWAQGLHVDRVDSEDQLDRLGLTLHENPLLGMQEHDLDDDAARVAIRVCLAGAEAVDLAGLPDCESGTEDDFDTAADLLVRLMELDGEPYRLEVRAMLSEHWPKVEAVAAALAEHGVLEGEQLEAVLC